jgi:large subunit ribosomal protein L29
MKINEIKELTVDELNEKLISLKKNLFDLKIAKANQKLENMTEIPKVKHQIAQIKTVIREKELSK